MLDEPAAVPEAALLVQAQPALLAQLPQEFRVHPSGLYARAIAPAAQGCAVPRMRRSRRRWGVARRTLTWIRHIQPVLQAKNRGTSMTRSKLTRRDALRGLGAGALAAAGTSLVSSEARAEHDEEKACKPSRRKGRILMDGHVHVTNKTFWLGIDTWEPSPTGTGWDYLRARQAGVNVIIENFGTYGYWNYNTTPKHMLRMFETFHRFAEKHSDKMAVALTVQDARDIAESGRMAVFLSCESGWDME